jgi:hypothetical protein
VATDADIGVGHVSVLGLERGGVDVDFEDAPEAEPATTRLLLKADVGMGEVRVHDSRGEFFYDDEDFGPFHDDDRSIDLTGAQRDECTVG